MEITLKLTSDPMSKVLNNEKKFDKKMEKVYDKTLENLLAFSEGHDGASATEIYVLCAQAMQEEFGQLNPPLMDATRELYSGLIELLESGLNAFEDANDIDFLSNPAIAKKWMA